MNIYMVVGDVLITKIELILFGTPYPPLCLKLWGEDSVGKFFNVYSVWFSFKEGLITTPIHFMRIK